MSANIVANVTISSNLYVPVTTQTTTVSQNLYVAISNDVGAIAASSTDGIAWTQRSMPVGTSRWAAAAVNSTTGVFVAVAGGPGSNAASSTNGINWTKRTLPATGDWRALAVNPNTGVFVALSGLSAIAAYSTDGVFWIQSALPVTAGWFSIACNPTTGVFVSVAFYNSSGQATTQAIASTDGINWTPVTLPSSRNWVGVACHPAGLFVAIATNSTAAASSTDGFSWTPRTLSSSSTWEAVTCNPTNGVFVAIASGTSLGARSTDGINWSTINLPSSAYWLGVTVNPTTSVFVAIANNSSTAASSTDGINWTPPRTLPVSTGWYPICASISATATTLASGLVSLGTTSGAYQLDLSTDGARKLTSTTWLTGSDRRIKTDIASANLQTCCDLINMLELKYFKWNFPEGTKVDDAHSLGFIAQDVREVFPYAVSVSNSYGYSDFLNLNVDQIDKALFGAVKYLAAKVEELEQSRSPMSQTP